MKYLAEFLARVSGIGSKASLIITDAYEVELSVWNQNSTLRFSKIFSMMDLYSTTDNGWKNLLQELEEEYQKDD